MKLLTLKLSSADPVLLVTLVSSGLTVRNDRPEVHLWDVDPATRRFATVVEDHISVVAKLSRQRAFPLHFLAVVFPKFAAARGGGVKTLR